MYIVCYCRLGGRITFLDKVSMCCLSPPSSGCEWLEATSAMCSDVTTTHFVGQYRIAARVQHNYREIILKLSNLTLTLSAMATITR